jgi:hypothetical protein
MRLQDSILRTHRAQENLLSDVRRVLLVPEDLPRASMNGRMEPLRYVF